MKTSEAGCKKGVHLIVRLLVAVSDFKLYTQHTIINIFKSQTTHNTILFKVPQGSLGHQKLLS